MPLTGIVLQELVGRGPDASLRGRSQGWTGWGMFCRLREVKKQEDSGMGEVFSRPPPHPAVSPLNRRGVGSSTGWKGSVVSEGHTSAAVAQHTGQDASVQLVELHQLQQICEPGLAFVHGEVEAALIFALWCGQRAGQRAVPGGGAAHGASNQPPFLVQGKRRRIVGLQVTDPPATRTQIRSRGPHSLVE